MTGKTVIRRTVFSLQVCLLACFTAAHAQIFFQEDFERVPVAGQTGDVPEGWILYNDNNRPHSTFGYCDRAWKIREMSGNNVAVAPSWFTSTNVRADRWMITPPIDLAQAVDPVLTFSARSFDAGERESYYVLVSTGDSAKASFIDTLLFVSGESGSWTRRIIDLSEYAGGKIRLAFVQRSLNRYALYVDDIQVSDLSTPLVRLSDLQYPTIVRPDSSFRLSAQASVLLRGEVESCTADYRLERIESKEARFGSAGGYETAGKSGSAVLGTMTAEPGEKTLRVQSEVLSLETPGSYAVALWVSSVNGNRAVISDTLYGTLEVSQEGYFFRRTLLEVFSSSTCGPCASANPRIRDAYESVYRSEQAPLLSVVKFQMDIPSPGDPCVINEGLYRKQWYALSGVPTLFLNGAKVTVSGGWENFRNDLPLRIDAEYAKSTPFGLEAEMTRDGNTFTVSVTLTNVVAWEGALLYVVFTEDSLYHSPQSNRETEFFHVARKVMPSAYGEELDLKVSGTRQYTYSHTFDGQKPRIFSGLDGLSAVVFVQDSKTREVLQSIHLPGKAASVGNTVSEADFRVQVWPNPCRDRCTLRWNTDKAETAVVEVCDLQGRVCRRFSSRYGSDGWHEADIPVAGLQKGLYILRVHFGNGIFTKKLMVC